NTFNESRTSYYLKSIGGYHAAKLRRYQDLIDEHLTQMNMKVINMLNTKYIIVEQDGSPVPMLNKEHLGNAWFVDEIILAETPNQESDALRVIDPATVAVTDSKFADFVTEPTTLTDPSASIELTSYAPDVLTYTSNCAYDKIAVFSEIYYPYGWKAYIDGTPVDHFRVNYLLRALNIPAGKHDIRFEFRPDSVMKGYKVSFAFIGVMYLILISSIVFGFYRVFVTKEDE
ncbi:MAG TPA: YfhO family protein, partial [Bacteroidales bacterium]|nr:YfhO family protein [Bacteroidales bacterium]